MSNRFRVTGSIDKHDARPVSLIIDDRIFLLTTAEADDLGLELIRKADASRSLSQFYASLLGAVESPAEVAPVVAREAVVRTKAKKAVTHKKLTTHYDGRANKPWQSRCSCGWASDRKSTKKETAWAWDEHAKETKK